MILSAPLAAEEVTVSSPAELRAALVRLEDGDTRCPDLTLTHLHTRGQTDNGINLDDGGERERPVAGITLAHLEVREVGPRGNHDGIKGSGLVELTIRDCLIEGWGGQGIDLVGCHRSLIAGCRLVFRRSQLRSDVNVGGGTAAETFAFEGNRWFAADRPEASRPQLPVAEQGGIFVAATANMPVGGPEMARSAPAQQSLPTTAVCGVQNSQRLMSGLMPSDAAYQRPSIREADEAAKIAQRLPHTLDPPRGSLGQATHAIGWATRFTFAGVPGRTPKSSRSYSDCCSIRGRTSANQVSGPLTSCQASGWVESGLARLRLMIPDGSTSNDGTMDHFGPWHTASLPGTSPDADHPLAGGDGNRLRFPPTPPAAAVSAGPGHGSACRRVL